MRAPGSGRTASEPHAGDRERKRPAGGHDPARNVPPGPAPARILIIKPSSLGDIVHTLPVLAALRRAWPDAHIAWLVASSFAPLLEGHPLLDEVVRFDRRYFGRMWYHPGAFVAFWRFVAAIRRRRYELILDLQGLARSGLISWFSGAPRRIGFSDARELAWLFYTQRVTCPDPDEHAVWRNLRFLETLGIAPGQPQFPLAVRPAERDRARELLCQAGLRGEEFCAVLPGARWDSKLWPAGHFAELITRLHAAGLPPPVLLGGPDERPRAERILAGCQGPVIDLVGRTSLRELVGLLERATLVICLDSGPMHLAAALNRPVVALFGPTNPDRTGPASPRARVLTHSVDCAPCYRRVCPLGHQNCLVQLRPQTVLDNVRELLSAAAGPPRR